MAQLWSLLRKIGNLGSKKNTKKTITAKKQNGSGQHSYGFLSENQ
jgi:hypothetical protein